ncbi:ABC transporter ATP-binding protein/permease [Streptomyces sp. NBC_00249]|uniref:ATP-binding cassette domain-containing protein n=1 Tax=Streptomyces sp. NBC_00249 TaxID=2975690 RepID=UPI00225BE054|nr:ABC transporter ATP-binding protein [Streptomyces sp. NBC_00249]MCX5199233.1 ABC transporter ATP-binding protein/permease [Streptomyces sp. NBC_00249]
MSESERLLFGGELAYDIGWERHEGAWLRLGLWTMAKGLPRLVGTGMRLASLADAHALRVVLGAEVGRGLTQAVGLVAVNSVLGHLLTDGTTNERLVRAVPALVVVAGAALLGSLLRSASTAATGTLEPKVQRVATERYLGLVHRVELAAVEDDEFHRLLDAARYGADSARGMIRYCTNTLNSAISLIAAAGVLTVLHPVLLPLLVLMTLPSAWSSLTISKQRYISFHTFVQHARAGHLLGQLLTQQEAAAEVRVHEVGPFLLGHFRNMAETSEREQTRLARRAARIGLVADGAGGVATLLTYGALGLLLWGGAMELAVAGTAVLAIRTGASSLDSLVLQITDLHQESLFVADYERLCREAEARAIPVGGEPLPEEVREVRFEEVTFTYPGSSGGGEQPEPTLREVSLSFPTGKIIALVGENGSGKSTLVKLLAGLYLPDEGGGTIRWDDVDARTADRAQVFARVALMSQNFFHWPFTFRVNVGIGESARPIDDRAVEEAAAYAGADEVLAGLPRGLGTLLARGYRGGHQISGGQWQRVGIARAKYRRAEILIVDEPTSALDAVAEQRVFDQIRSLAATTGQTIVLITHRLHSVRHADLIHVLKDGRVAESGTFAELMDEKTGTGDFRDAYLVQAAAFDAPLPGQSAGDHDALPAAKDRT